MTACEPCRNDANDLLTTLGVPKEAWGRAYRALHRRHLTGIAEGQMAPRQPKGG